MKLSIIIPCHFTHFLFLDPLLKEFEKQTILPDEIIISLSEAHHLPQKKIETIKKTKRPFTLIFLATNEKRTAGENRNIASKKASGDIFIYQDADDLPHRQRVEIITYFFTQYPLDALYHTFCIDDLSFNKRIQKEEIQHFFVKKFYQITNIQFPFGNLCIKAKVFETIKWGSYLRREDIFYQREIFQKFENILAINTPLLWYRRKYSTLDNRKEFFSEEETRVIRDTFIQTKPSFSKNSEAYEHNLGNLWLKQYCDQESL